MAEKLPRNLEISAQQLIFPCSRPSIGIARMKVACRNHSEMPGADRQSALGIPQNTTAEFAYRLLHSHFIWRKTILWIELQHVAAWNAIDRDRVFIT